MPVGWIGLDKSKLAQELFAVNVFLKTVSQKPLFKNLQRKLDSDVADVSISNILIWTPDKDNVIDCRCVCFSVTKQMSNHLFWELV